MIEKEKYRKRRTGQKTNENYREAQKGIENQRKGQETRENYRIKEQERKKK